MFDAASYFISRDFSAISVECGQFSILSQPKLGVVDRTLVVYHLHGQTGRFTVWVNGSQSSGVVNFVPESRLPFVEISSIYRKKAVKA